MNGYKAFFQGKEIEIYAESLYGAKLKAIQTFKPKKNKEHMISIVLCEKNGIEISHIPVD